MTKKLQIILFVAFCLVAIPTVRAQSVSGVFENLSANKQSGDMDGMRISIFRAGAGDAYHAIVQIAGGGADEPEPVLVDVTVKGKTISFKAGETTYKGTVTATRLRIKPEGGTTENLRRQPNSSFFR